MLRIVRDGKLTRLAVGVSALVFVALITLVLTRRHDGSRPGLTSSPGRSPELNTQKGRDLLPQNPPDSRGPRYPIDENIGYPAAPLPLTGEAGSDDSPALPPSLPSEGSHHVPVPPAKIHPLSEASAVMGWPTTADGKIGETHTKPLPLDAAPVVSKTTAVPITTPLKSAAEIVGAAPGVSPADVGLTKTHPLPKDGKIPD